MKIIPQSDKWRRVAFFLSIAFGVAVWVWLYFYQFEAAWKRGTLLVSTVVSVWGFALGGAVYYAFSDPKGALALDISDDLERVRLQHVNEGAMKDANMPDGQPVTKPLEGVDGHDEVMLTVNSTIPKPDDDDLDDEGDLTLRATWEKTATPDEFAASRERIQEVYGELSRESQRLIMLRSTFSSVVRRSVRRISDHVHGTVEKGEIPDGDVIGKVLRQTFEEHGMSYLDDDLDDESDEKAANGSSEKPDLTVENVGELDMQGLLEGSGFGGGDGD